MRKTVTAAVLAASMAAGAGAGVALFAPSGAGAQGGQTSAAIATAGDQTAAPAATDPSTSDPSTNPSNGTAPAQQAPTIPPPWVTDALKPLVDNGTITQAQADAAAKALAAAAPRGGHGPGGPGGPAGFGGGPHELGDDLSIAAKAIGISDADLKTALQSGQSLAAVAKAHNVDPQKVIDALVADEDAELADQVKNGQLTQAQADQIKPNIAQRVTDRVNNAGGPHGGPGGRHGGPGGPGGPGQPPADGQQPAPANGSGSVSG